MDPFTQIFIYHKHCVYIITGDREFRSQETSYCKIYHPVRTADILQYCKIEFGLYHGNPKAYSGLALYISTASPQSTYCMSLPDLYSSRRGKGRELADPLLHTPICLHSCRFTPLVLFEKRSIIKLASSQ